MSAEITSAEVEHVVCKTSMTARPTSKAIIPEAIVCVAHFCGLEYHDSSRKAVSQFIPRGRHTWLRRATMNGIHLITMLGMGLFTSSALMAQEAVKSPAAGYSIHILAPHRHEDGTVHGPYHHYCKAIKAQVMQCMIFMSTDPNAELVEIEYFIDKKLVRSNVTLEQWNRHYHDHAAEVASGNVQVLDATAQQAKEIAAAASKTDGIIFHLWPMGSKVPNGDVTFPTAISHKPVASLLIPD